MKIAVIGGIGAGKSTALDILKSYNFETYDADEINREILEREDIQEQLLQEFPDAFVDGKLDKTKLRDIIFSSKETYDKATEIITVEVKREIREILNTTTVDTAVEMSLIDEELLNMFDYIMCIDADEELRLKFLKKRGMDAETAKKIMSFQPEDVDYMDYADWVIDNSGKKRSLENLIYFFLVRFCGFFGE
mgnify:CR=1 FL=1